MDNGTTSDARGRRQHRRPSRLTIAGVIARRTPTLLPLVAWLSLMLSLFPVAAGGTVAKRVKSGTGFFVSGDGFLVTSAHVVTGCRHIAVWAADGTESASYVIAMDPHADVALLWADGRRPRHPAAIAPRAPQSGQPVWTLGYGVVATKPLDPVLAEGVLVGSGTTSSGNRVLMIRARLHRGASGGPVLAQDGTLIGMVIGRDDTNPDLGVAVPDAEIAALLRRYGIRFVQREPSANARDLLFAMSVLVQCTA